jgi:hypothetical protein
MKASSCPFCGGTNIILYYPASSNNNFAQISCRDCLSKGPLIQCEPDDNFAKREEKILSAWEHRGE